ncbi:ABC transporter permease [Pseudoduganella sp. UC29_106]|uniref:ABC transporter permease n=1 Tax=Pseudoduganella sp. UC29_106 TaxID=3374553 RepID=UPI0037574AC9
MNDRASPGTAPAIAAAQPSAAPNAPPPDAFIPARPAIYRVATWAAVGTIARYTLLEAVRGRLLWLVLAAALAGAGISGLLSAIALTETRETQLALVAAALRLASVALMAAFVVTGMAREAADKGTEMLLALPIPRTAWLAGKLAGFASAALLPAVLFGAVIAFFAAPVQAALWSLSLLLELWLIVAFAVFCTITLTRPVPALAMVAGFYLLSRSLGTLQLLGHAPTSDATQRAISTAIDAIALLLPRLDQFTQTAWLLYGSGSLPALALIGAQTAIYLVLLVAASAFDLHRRDF